MNREPLTGNGNAQMATGMFTRIARLTSREWFSDARIAGHFSNAHGVGTLDRKEGET
jgi:hypothetical protein